MTQSELAEEIDASVKHISYIENPTRYRLSVLTSYAIRKRILPFFKPVEHICISGMYKNHAAAKPPERSSTLLKIRQKALTGP